MDLGFEPPAESLLVRAESAVLAGAVGPLIDNALDALEQSACAGHVGVRITSSDDDRTIDVIVEDDGPGLTPSAEALAFDPFFTTRPASGGLGLGLVFARAAASRCGGSITLEPRSGSGTRAVFHLPRHVPPRAHVPASRDDTR